MSQFTLCITLRKGTDTPDEAEAIYNLVKQRFEDRPEIKISGHVTNHYDEAGGQAEPD